MRRGHHQRDSLVPLIAVFIGGGGRLIEAGLEKLAKKKKNGYRTREDLLFTASEMWQCLRKIWDKGWLYVLLLLVIIDNRMMEK